MYKLLCMPHFMYCINYQEILNMCKLQLSQHAVYQVPTICIIGDVYAMISQIRLSVNHCAQMILVAKVM